MKSTMKNIITMVVMCMAFLCANTANAQKKEASSNKLTPMESIVCAVDKDFSIVRDDQTRRNTFTLRHRKTLKYAFSTKFEKYLDTFSLDGKSFIAVATWNPAFNYMWGAYIRDGKEWKQILQQQYTELSVIKEDGEPTRIKCTNIDGTQSTYTLQELLTK